MKKVKLIAIAALLSIAFTSNAAGGKVTLRHNGNIIKVSINALGAHLAQGDVQVFQFNGEWLSVDEIEVILAADGYIFDGIDENGNVMYHDGVNNEGGTGGVIGG